MNPNQNYFGVTARNSLSAGTGNVEISERELWLVCATDNDVSIREWVAGYSRTPVDIMRMLVEDPSPVVRSRLAENQSCPLPVLEQLMCDTDAHVRFCAMRTLKSWQGCSRLMPRTKLTQTANDF